MQEIACVGENATTGQTMQLPLDNCDQELGASARPQETLPCNIPCKGLSADGHIDRILRLPPFAATVSGHADIWPTSGTRNRFFIHTKLDGQDDGLYIMSKPTDDVTLASVESMAVAPREESCPSRTFGGKQQPRLPHVAGFLAADKISSNVLAGTHVISEVRISN